MADRSGHRCNLCFPEQEGHTLDRPPLSCPPHLSVHFRDVICPAQGKFGGFSLNCIQTAEFNSLVCPLEAG